MAEYIEREAALDACLNGWGLDEATVSLIRENIRKLPAADARPVRRGRWKKVPCHETDEAYTYICPFCRWCMIAIKPMNYCPNCGADMREERWAQIVCNKCGGKRFISRGGLLVCDKCGAKMEES